MNTDSQQTKGFERSIGALLLALLIVGSLVVLWPFVSSLLWAIVLTFTAWPLYRRMLAATNGRRSLAALLMTLAAALVLLVPLLLVTVSLADDVKHMTTAARGWLKAGPSPPPPWVVKVPLVGSQLSTYWASIVGDTQQLWHDLSDYIEPALSWLLRGGLTVGGAIGQLALSILIAFFLFRDGAGAAERVKAGVHRIASDRGGQLLDVAGKTVRSVVYGILGTALVQGVMAGIGFFIAGVPGAGLLGLLTFFLSIVPMGPPLVWAPAALWLFARGSIGWGIFMLIWGLAVSSIDNVVKPWLISQGTDLPFVLILLGVLGGAVAFGFIGVLLGPTLLAVTYSLITKWADPSPLNSETPIQQPP